MLHPNPASILEQGIDLLAPAECCLGDLQLYKTPSWGQAFWFIAANNTVVVILYLLAIHL